jgi:integrase
MAKPRTILTTTFQEVQSQTKVKAFLDRKKLDSPKTAATYLACLTKFQDFLNINEYHITLNDVDSFFKKENVYEVINKFVIYLAENKIASNTIRLYTKAVKGYLENCDVEINQTKYKNKVTIPKNHREDEAPINDADIRKILLACNNARLRVLILLLASGGMRVIEALAIRLKDIDMSVVPTKIHIRKDYCKTRVARNIYISEEATTYLKQYIERKYSGKRVRKEDDLLFQIHPNNKAGPEGIYNKLLDPFQRLLKSTGLEERKEGMARRKVTFHSFRRFAKTVIANQTSTDYNEWFLGHSKSPYFVQKEFDRRMLYATKCMPFLTFVNYSQLEENADKKQSDLESLMMKDANKDREIETLKQQVQVLRKENDMLKNRDASSNDKLIMLSDQLVKVTNALQKAGIKLE